MQPFKQWLNRNRNKAKAPWPPGVDQRYLGRDDDGRPVFQLRLGAIMTPDFYLSYHRDQGQHIGLNAFVGDN